MRTAAQWLAAAFVAWWVITAPLTAAATVRHIGTLATGAAGSLATLISHL